MSEINDGGPAFPLYLGVYNEPKPKHNHGMSLRDYFAAKALLGILSSSDDVLCNSTTSEGKAIERRVYAAEIAESSYRFADAMIAARKAVQK
jgi:hypothetical protein